MIKKKVIFSAFDGLSGGQIALNNLGFTQNDYVYFRSEVDKYADIVAMKNYPNSINLGDITKITADMFPCKINLMLGGSPCQGFSFAGKRLNFDDPRSKLFFTWVDLLKELKPEYFLFENVRMSKQSQDVISEYLGVQPITINSNLTSAQNRHRLYWTNLPLENEQPEDLKIVLSDILEHGLTDRDKAHCIDANYFKGGNLKSYFEKHRRQLIFSAEGLAHVGEADLKGFDVIKRVYHEDGKAPTLTTMQGGHREPKVLCYPEVIGAFRGRYKQSDGSVKSSPTSEDNKVFQQLELRFDDKTNSLTSVQKDNVVVQRHDHVDVDEYAWRKLTPLECERLQTIPENYTKHVSNTQRYRMSGNGWTISVIEHLLRDWVKEHFNTIDQFQSQAETQQGV